MSDRKFGAHGSMPTGTLRTNPKRYSSGKYIVSIPGVLKIFSIILFLASSIIFLSSPVCLGTPPWYAKLYPISSTTVGVLIAVLYALFATGVVRKGFPIWNMIDILINTLSFVLMFTVSILTTASCAHSSYSSQLVPGPLGIIGSILLAASTTMWLVQSRTTKELVLAQETNVSAISATTYRKSVVA